MSKRRSFCSGRPTWLGLKWVPETKLSFQHSHVPMSNCPSLRPLINCGGRRFLATVRQNLTLTDHNGSVNKISLQPLGIYHFSCQYFFPSQRTGLGSCASRLNLHFPLFTEGQFQFIPWTTSALLNNSMFTTPVFDIPPPLTLDKTTLKSLNETYNALASDLTRRLHTVRAEINTLPTNSYCTVSQALIYLTLALKICNFGVMLIFYCVCLRRRENTSSQSFVVAQRSRKAAGTSATDV